MSSVIASKVVGKRPVMNTDHPIYVEVRRFGPRRWTVAMVCNGTAMWHQDYATRREALAEYNSPVWPEAHS